MGFFKVIELKYITDLLNFAGLIENIYPELVPTEWWSVWLLSGGASRSLCPVDLSNIGKMQELKQLFYFADSILNMKSSAKT